MSDDLTAAVARARKIAQNAAHTLACVADAESILAVCAALEQAQQEIARLHVQLRDVTKTVTACALEVTRPTEALARTLARALADADGGYEAELRRQATLALGAVQALLKA